MPRFFLFASLLPLFLWTVANRWGGVQTSAGVDPTAGWLERWEQGLGSWGLAPAVVLALLLAGLAQLPRLRQEPLASATPVPPLKAWTGFLLVGHCTVYLWVALFRGATPLALQMLYSVWMLLGLLTCRPELQVRFRPGWWRWGLAAYSLTFVGALLYGLLVQPTPSVNPVAELFVRADLGQRIGWVFTLCVLTPLVEESWYRRVLGGPGWRRALLIALLFALVHADPSAFVPLLWMGLVFHWACWHGCLPAAVLAHALWNGTVAVWYLGGALGGA